MDTGDILKKYEEKLGKQIDLDEYKAEKFSREYEIFRKETLEFNISVYEKFCNQAEKIIKIRPDSKSKNKLLESIEASHLEITPEGAMSFAVLTAALFIFFGIFIGVLNFFLKIGFFIPLMLVFAGLFSLKFFSDYPNKIAFRWRLDVSNQMVNCILYVVMYMRHTSNLEHAIKFASEHIGGALALDLRKVFWNVEVSKFSNIKNSLDNYLEKWRNYSLEFVESFHLIESSLYEGNEEKRISTLEKSLEVMLEASYDKMMHYAREIVNPITMLHMLGVILPILGMVIFPLVGAFMQGAVKWWHIAILYNIFLPIGVLYLGYNILERRPTGYGESEIIKDHPGYKKYQVLNFLGVETSPLIISLFIGIFFLIIGFIPVIINLLSPGYEFNFLGSKFFDYKCNGECTGPFGLGALLLSLLVPLGISLAISIYYKIKSNRLIKIKDNVDKLEKEFSGGLFQLGNRVADGIPVEVAFGKVAESMKNTPTGDFFRVISNNIQRFGFGVKEAIFNKQRGAVIFFPSKLIESSMKILIEGARKGPQVVAKSLLTFSNYTNRIHQVNERLKDLLAEVVSSMKSQISFLTPMIAGIVVAVSSMIVTIINLLGEQLKTASGGELGGMAGFVNIFKIEQVIPSFYFQMVIGIYVVEITVILCILVNGIENGINKLKEENLIGKSLINSTLLYVVIALIGIFIFNLLSKGIITATT